MNILLIGHWDHGGNLVITESHGVGTDDTETAQLIDPDDVGSMGWAAEFNVDTHARAVQEAYEVYVRHEGTRLFDEAEGFTVATD